MRLVSSGNFTTRRPVAPPRLTGEQRGVSSSVGVVGFVHPASLHFSWFFCCGARMHRRGVAFGSDAQRTVPYVFFRARIGARLVSTAPSEPSPRTTMRNAGSGFPAAEGLPCRQMRHRRIDKQEPDALSLALKPDKMNPVSSGQQELSCRRNPSPEEKK